MQKCLKKPSAPDLIGTGEKRVRFSFAAYCGFRPMTAVNRKIIAQAKDVGSDRCDQLFIITAGQIRAPNRSVKKAISRKHASLFFFD